MGARRVPGLPERLGGVPSRERERWLSAVLLVAAIVAIAVGVRQWPVVSRARSVPAPLASRPLYLVAAPPIVEFAAPIAPEPPPATEVATGEIPAAVTAPEPVLASGEVATAPGPDPPTPGAPALLPLLAGRRVDLTSTVPTLTMVSVQEIAPPSESHGLVELPAVAMTRVVGVAGRGIMSGLRVTGAVFRAAF